MKTYILYLTLSLSTFLPSCVISNQSSEEITTINSATLNTLIDNFEVDTLINNSNLKLVKFDTLPKDFNSLTLLPRFLDLVFCLDEQGSLMAHGQSNEVSYNDHSITGRDILLYPSEDMQNPYSVHVATAGLENKNLVLYARYFPSKNGKDAYYLLYFLDLGSK